MRRAVVFFDVGDVVLFDDGNGWFVFIAFYIDQVDVFFYFITIVFFYVC